MTRPYGSVADLPEAVKKLPAHAQEVWLAAYNAAYEQSDGDEAKAAATAWAAVKKAGYEQDADGAWHKKACAEGKARRYESEERVLDVNEPKLQITCVVTSETEARDGMVLLLDGVRYVDGDRIPLLWTHGYGLRDDLPTGSVSGFRVEEVDGIPCIVGVKTYYQPGEAVQHLQSDAVTLPAVIFDMRRQGHFRGTSIGFRVRTHEMRVPKFPRYSEDGAEVPHVTEWELLELSDVAVPADPYAIDLSFSRAVADGRLTERQKELLIGRECRGCGRCDDAGRQPAPQPASRSVKELLDMWLR
ncbi:hypothetical protein FJY71_00280 [candidate division WOR-3 bacterium]|nr:hypothetical protein [candidate division WOR-3 bacterium]